MIVWKDIPEYEGLYLVSNKGQVLSCSKYKEYNKHKQWHQGVLLKPSSNKNGYLQVVLYKEGTKKTYKVHRLVALAFIPNPNNYSIINHKDEVVTNNCVENLEWCTNTYNIVYSLKQTYTLKDPNGKQHTFSCMEHFCKENDLSSPNIFKVLNGKRNHHKGWTKHE